MATPPKPSLTIKEQRAEKRAAQLAAFKKKEAASKRNRILGIVAAVVALLLVAGTVTTVLVINAAPPQQIEGVQRYSDLESTHTETRVSYDQTPPVGGPHNPAWLNCGVYNEPQQNENVVHTLEHGAVWITYDPATTTDAEVEALVALAPDTYSVVSPYEGIGTMAISAWGAQLFFTDVADPAVEDFLTEFYRSPNSPEPNAPCTGAIDGPGKVS
jgi:hypothetical protein